MANKIIKNSVKRPLTHVTCRRCNVNEIVKYQVSKNEKDVLRPYIPDDKVSWSVKWDDYKHLVLAYTSLNVLGNPSWADSNSPIKIKNWNKVDGEVDRRSFHGEYSLENGVPLNPIGRTGICGRGLLGKWGPNHAADPIVTRWKTDNQNQKVKNLTTNKNILTFVAIQRGDTKQWAIPGGMCDAGENISNTLKREFMEEAMNSIDMDDKKKEKCKEMLKNFFNGGVEIYRGYVDDPRNTDNSWMETTAYHFHDEDGSVFRNLKLEAGDDAHRVKWLDISSSLELYASHKEFVKKVAERLNAHW